MHATFGQLALVYCSMNIICPTEIQEMVGVCVQFLSGIAELLIHVYLIQNLTTSYPKMALSLNLPKMAPSLQGASTFVNTVTFELINARCLGFDLNKKPMMQHREDSVAFYFKPSWVGKDERTILHL